MNAWGLTILERWLFDGGYEVAAGLVGAYTHTLICIHTHNYMYTHVLNYTHNNYIHESMVECEPEILAPNLCDGACEIAAHSVGAHAHCI